MAAALALSAGLIAAAPAAAVETLPAKDASRTAAATTGTGGAPVKKKKKKAPQTQTVEPRAKGRRMQGGTQYITGERPGGEQKITAFPHDQAAVDKAFAEHRRDQIVDAENSARAPDVKDRWHTVLFFLRDLQSHPDPETCFWRVLAFYRLGEVGRARNIREDCELAPRDRVTLDEEDVTAANLQPPGSVPEPKTAGAREPEKTSRSQVQPVMNTAAYSGPSPARFK
jgi:hypothetical protein